MKIYLDGKFVSLDAASRRFLDSGLLRGYGIFETMRAYKGNIIYLDAHLERFRNSAKFLRLKVPRAQEFLKYALYKTIRQNKIKDAYVKLAAFQGEKKTHMFIIIKKYHPYPEKKYEQGFKIKISPFRWTPDLKFSRIKTLSRGLLELAYNEAKKNGFDEAILLNQDGYVVEGSRTNIFLVKNNKLYTPSLDCGCLEGITRKVVLDLAKEKGLLSYETKLGKKDILNAEEVFLTNSLSGIMPVAICERKKIGSWPAAKLTQFFMKEYNNIKERLCLRRIIR
ncbi:MAG: aminotransferase class IV [Candidatus Omnitrophica bacterium]|nr:aminotransferase class IV [Candidatus Omnitrophota bacterium]MCM8770990.1 aminotransferase class IV [Candidatus Omnitrophota bacterium]